jgi:hypothetical protein
MKPEQARQLFINHCKPGGAATLQRYGTQAAIDAIGTLTGFIEAEARRYAGHYSEGTDGRNTFVMFADMVADLTADRVRLPDGLRRHDGQLQFQCRVCEHWTEWPDDVADFDPDAPENMCGGSPRCCP